jgi:predicted ATP-grasp superfamily ATP-dependent carboligase
VPTQNKPTIVIAAISSRPYVKAALDAGYAVIAIDAFVDQDTQAMAQQCIQVACNQHQFDGDALLAAIDTLNHQDILGFCFGAGFEAQPELIACIEKRLLLLGNKADTVKRCKDPTVFATFCQSLNFATPAIQFNMPANAEGWLVKEVGGSGGSHVRLAQTQASPLASGHYYQQFQAGLPISCLFLASKHQSQLIGVNEQWLASDAQAPFKYGGAASHLALDVSLLSELKRFIALATQQFNLRGLNSVDALLYDNRLVFLEINPRLSASIDLYSSQEGALLASHIEVFKTQQLPALTVSSQSKAHYIVYAKQSTKIDAHHTWPDWVCDIPNQSQTFEAGMPICTVVSIAENVQMAKQIVQARVASL